VLRNPNGLPRRPIQPLEAPSLASRESPGSASTFFSFFTPCRPFRFLFLDYVNLIIHEGGHFFLQLVRQHHHDSGGTLGELLVPLLCAIYFSGSAKLLASLLQLLVLRKNFPYIGTYMADARSASLPLRRLRGERLGPSSSASGPPRPGSENRPPPCAPSASRHARHHCHGSPTASAKMPPQVPLAILVTTKPVQFTPLRLKIFAKTELVEILHRAGPAGRFPIYAEAKEG